MREEIINNIAILATNYGVQDVRKFKNELYITLNNVELMKRTTEIVVVDENKNNMFIRKFIVAKTIKGCTDRTIAYYEQEIRQFLNAVKKNADEVLADDIRLYLAIKLKRDGVSEVTANNITRCLSSFYGFLQVEELVTKNPMSKLEPIKIAKTKKEAFTEIEVERMRNACRNNKQRALFELLLSTGCRAEECTSIRIDDLKSDGTITIFGKGKKERVVYLNAKARVAIDAYLPERKDNSPYLFPKMLGLNQLDKNNKEMRSNFLKHDSYKYPELVTNRQSEPTLINNAVKKIAKQAGVQKCHTHKFRRTCATFALRRGMPLINVSKMLGHDSIDTTRIYLDISEEEMAQAHKKYM